MPSAAERGGMLRAVERRVPDWVWSPRDNWSRLKGYGRMIIFIGMVAFFGGSNPIATALFVVGIVLYGIGLLGLRQTIEKRRKGVGGNA